MKEGDLTIRVELDGRAVRLVFILPDESEAQEIAADLNNQLDHGRLLLQFRGQFSENQ